MITIQEYIDIHCTPLESGHGKTRLLQSIYKKNVFPFHLSILSETSYSIKPTYASNIPSILDLKREHVLFKRLQTLARYNVWR